jgi:hypothetical protein
VLEVPKEFKEGNAMQITLPVISYMRTIAVAQTWLKVECIRSQIGALYNVDVLNAREYRELNDICNARIAELEREGIPELQ